MCQQSRRRRPTTDDLNPFAISHHRNWGGTTHDQLRSDLPGFVFPALQLPSAVASTDSKPQRSKTPPSPTPSRTASATERNVRDPSTSPSSFQRRCILAPKEFPSNATELHRQTEIFRAFDTAGAASFAPATCVQRQRTGCCMTGSLLPGTGGGEKIAR